MKKFVRPVAVLCAAAMLGACASPYQAQMGALHQQYVNGQVSESEYRHEMARLQRNDAGWQQQNANNVTTAAVGAAAVAGAIALAEDGHHHHHGRYYYRHGHRYWY